MFRHQQAQRPALPAQRLEHPPQSLARQRSLWHLSNTPNRSPTQILALHIARTAPVIAQPVPVLGSITTIVLSPSHALLGDSCGWLYTAHHRQWVIDSSLGSHSEVSSLNIALDAFSLATSFGPSSKIRVQKLVDANLSCLIMPRGVHDIRCSHYSVHPDQAIIGAKNHAVYITDIFNQPKSTFFHTHSDVFSLTRQHDLVYAGTRNGSIHRFDLRIPPPSKNRVPATIIFPNSSTVLYMQPIHDVYFLSSYMNGQILMYDIRFPKPHSPILRFPGHVNTYTSRLGIAVDSSSTFLFAAGQDRKLRAWSISTAQPLLPPPPPSSSHPFFSMEFPQPIQTLQTISSPNHLQEHVPSGLTLWAGCGDELYTFHLGSVA